MGSDSNTTALYPGVARDKDAPNICPITKCSHEVANMYINGWITNKGDAISKAFFRPSLSASIPPGNCARSLDDIPITDNKATNSTLSPCSKR